MALAASYNLGHPKFKIECCADGPTSPSIDDSSLSSFSGPKSGLNKVSFLSEANPSSGSSWNGAVGLEMVWDLIRRLLPPRAQRWEPELEGN